MTQRLAVVGGGITGLAAAWEGVAHGADVTIYEATDRFGGKVYTTPFAGRPVDAGADAFLCRVPDARGWCEELGIAGELIPPATGTAYVWFDGGLHQIPDGVFGVPVDGSVAERDVGPLAADEDPSIGAFVRSRFGDEVAERWVGPLVGGINGGDIDRLSLRAVTPQFAAAATVATTATGSGVVEQLRAMQAEADAGPLFGAPATGMGRLVEAAVEQLQERGAQLHLGTAIDTLDELDADAVVVTTPAPAAARLVRPAAPDAAAALAGVEYASVVLVTLAFPADAVSVTLHGSGFLVPRCEPLLLTACSWASSKWAFGPDPVVVRASAGRHGEDRAMDMDDDRLVERLVEDLTVTMGLRSGPTEVRVTRWPRSFPQYAPGHLDRADAIERSLAEQAPTVTVTGAALRGLGVPACIRQGRDAVRRLLDVGIAAR